MHNHLKKARLVTGFAALILAAVACQAPNGGTGFSPVSSSAISSLPSGIASDNHKKKHRVKITSTCGDRVHIALLGFVDCKFDEKGYGDGTFTLTSKVSGLVSVDPTTGTRATTFTITGLLVGKGTVVVKDSKGHHLTLRIKVTL
jgi:hypothetical protein